MEAPEAGQATLARGGCQGGLLSRLSSRLMAHLFLEHMHRVEALPVSRCPAPPSLG